MTGNGRGASRARSASAAHRRPASARAAQGEQLPAGESAERRRSDLLADSRPLVVGILGSPRTQSNTRVLLERVLAAAEAGGAQTQFIALRELCYGSCRHCGGCDRTGLCVVRDDADMIYERVQAGHHLVLAFPIHFAGVSGETKMMIDRAQCCWVATYRLKQPVSAVAGERRGLFVATCGGTDVRVFDYAKPTVKAFFSSCGFRYWGELLEADTDGLPPICERPNVLGRAEELGRSLLEP